MVNSEKYLSLLNFSSASGSQATTGAAQELSLEQKKERFLLDKEFQQHLYHQILKFTTLGLIEKHVVNCNQRYDF